MDRVESKVKKEGRCRVCRVTGYEANIEGAHTWDRSLGKSKSEDLIIPLCSACHTKYDAHLLNILPYLTTQEQAAMVMAARSIARAYDRGRGKKRQES